MPLHHTKDTGRCGADNIYAGNAGAEFWGAASGNIYNSSGNSIATNRPAQNFFCYWDGDLEREILDGNTITKYINPNTINTLLTASGCDSCNGEQIHIDSSSIRNEQTM